MPHSCICTIVCAHLLRSTKQPLLRSSLLLPNLFQPSLSRRTPSLPLTNLTLPYQPLQHKILRHILSILPLFFLNLLLRYRLPIPIHRHIRNHKLLRSMRIQNPHPLHMHQRLLTPYPHNSLHDSRPLLITSLNIRHREHIRYTSRSFEVFV
ncbi:hypothetical protein HII31_10947 [Pseudocercospora fuligena]|uniref:Uncharacterized protein n=1 Tax=Pseudocercospora fuligena TaxID=685502 RepID=A0A8H6RAQ0_9PEZI|nr:hypothetical protein HII31_10947 [Pseudocercospora fuligena]